MPGNVEGSPLLSKSARTRSIAIFSIRMVSSTKLSSLWGEQSPIDEKWICVSEENVDNYDQIVVKKVQKYSKNMTLPSGSSLQSILVFSASSFPCSFQTVANLIAS